jgi:hypothetical protein
MEFEKRYFSTKKSQKTPSKISQKNQQKSLKPHPTPCVFKHQQIQHTACFQHIY